ncbi:MAG: UDP-N-acetylmuramoyl-L-alanine--D-glutamate ligase [Magnetococcales bacterium]|nr:UDP-N-acetylmuramoyl-L-alanine--D-glutamate ligase [Magnetococcales bacterium]
MIPHSAPIGVIGLGRSGSAALRLLANSGLPVRAWDGRNEPLQPFSALPGVECFSGDPLPTAPFLGCQTILLSPGIPRALPEIQTLTAANIPIINDIEWLHTLVRDAHPNATFIGITGSNGKSTVTSLIGAMLARHQSDVVTGGNLGVPALELWQPEHRVYVLELSSFQLESIAAFRAEIAVHLNLTPDHLDRYPDLEAYHQAKLRLFANSQPGDHAILNADDPMLSDALTQLRQRQITVIPFSITRTLPGGVYVQDDHLIDHRDPTPRTLLPTAQIAIQGAHNQANAAAATAAALAAGVPIEAILDILTTFPGLPHRMEPVRQLHGVTYFNDSKGTNIGATLMSLRSFAANSVILIAGGRDKKGDFSTLAPVASTIVTDAILLGEAADDLARALAGGPRLHRVQEMTQAVQLAHTLAKPGQSVLLSPACASFDMFKNFEERGARFRAAVHGL